MNATFVPFISLGSASGLGAAAENTGASPRQSFKPISTEASASQVEANRPGPVAHQPTVKVHREGDSVRRIQIQCSCGQIIDLDCQY